MVYCSLSLSGASDFQTKHPRQRRQRLCIAAKGKQRQTTGEVSYGRDWYKQTREQARRFSTVREELEWRRKANWEANKGRDRKDLYTDNWDGDVYKGSKFNVLTVIGLLFVLVPVVGLAFAYWSYGVLWG